MANDPASQAVSAQLNARYRADVWINMQLEPMVKLWQGIGGRSDFFVSEEDAREARGAYVGTQPYEFAQTLWRLAQIQPSLKHGFRHGIREFVVGIRIAAAVGICRANGALGSGSVFQYYVPNWASSLRATGRTHRFNETAYP
jgi:hypothetical protein